MEVIKTNDYEMEIVSRVSKTSSSFLEFVRKRPSMFIAGCNELGICFLVKNVVDYLYHDIGSRDIAIEVYEDNVIKAISKDKGICVEDRNDLEESKLNTLELAFGSREYFYKDHDPAIANALSEWFTVETKGCGKHYKEEFYSPNIDGIISPGIVKTPLELVGETSENETVITFKLDKNVFKNVKCNYDLLFEKMIKHSGELKDLKLSMSDKHSA